jgi:cyclase
MRTSIMKVQYALFALLVPIAASAQTLGAVHIFHEISDGILVAEPRYGGGNSTILINSDHVIVVDPQGSHAAAVALIDEIRRLTPLPVRYVINTHWHGDHHGGNAAFRAAFPDTEIIAHSKTVEGIEQYANAEIHQVAPFLRTAVRVAEQDLQRRARAGAPLTDEQIAQLARFVESEVAFLEDVPADFRYAVPTRIVDDVLVLEDPRRRLEIRHPGRAHTEGDLYVFVPADGILIAGDLVTVPYVVPRSGFPESYAAVLRHIDARAPEIVVPGHGRPGDHRRLISVMIDFLADVATFARESIDGGLTLTAAAEAAALDPTITDFESRIEWDAGGGLTFLDFRTLVLMTLQRAYAELNGQPR